MGFQTALRLIYPPQCMTCGDPVESDFGLCGPCWRDTPFITGLVCDCCGTPLPGEDRGDRMRCDDCLVIARPWIRGRAALIYGGNGRKLVLALKHGDRQDILRPAVGWMAKAVQPILPKDPLIVPVPLHWMRLLRRRYNQSALLTIGLARELNADHCPDLLLRPVRTPSLDGLTRADRLELMQNKIKANPKQSHRMAGRNILLVDDVMTSGATLAACANACITAGAKDVCVVTLARVAKKT